MLNMSSFKANAKVEAEQDSPYVKVNESHEAMQESLNARRLTRRRYKIILFSFVVLVVAVAALIGTTVSNNNRRNGSGGSLQESGVSSTVRAVCHVTPYPDSCYTTLFPMVNSSSSTVSPQQLFKLSLQVAMSELSRSLRRFSDHRNITGRGNMTTEALDNCMELLDLAIDHLNVSDSDSDDQSLFDAADDLITWLGSAGTFHQTCLDGLLEAEDSVLLASFVESLKNSTELTSNSLAIVTWISKVKDSVKLRRRLLSSVKHVDGGPQWMGSRDRKLFVEESWDLRKRANIVVAKDGSGKYRTIGEALKNVPDKSKKRTVIYVKKGIYYENVRVEKTKWNVVMVGDGMTATIVSGSRNFVDGTPTFSSATFAVFGNGFVARDMGFRNTAGAKKHQAVALMASADMVAFYKCAIDAFQDSLYAHANRQFYRECDIYGTVDFIFGNSAAVLQNCNIRPRVPMAGQQNTITAQGRTDQNQRTGLSLQNCTISPFGDLSSVRTFLGRPWKNYSTTVYMNSYMTWFIDPRGWMPWVGDSAPNTIFYSEFGNFGPGSSTRNRVKWQGLRGISHKEADRFTVHSFLQGTKWISDTGVPFKSGL